MTWSNILAYVLGLLTIPLAILMLTVGTSVLAATYETRFLIGAAWMCRHHRRPYSLHEWVWAAVKIWFKTLYSGRESVYGYQARASDGTTIVITKGRYGKPIMGNKED